MSDTQGSARCRLINIRRCAFVGILFVAINCGCVTEQYSEFRGTITHGVVTIGPEAHPLGGQFHYREPSGTDALTGFSLGHGHGMIVLVHDRQRYVSSGQRLSNDTISAVYWVDWSIAEQNRWKSFLVQDVITRAQARGVHHLKGPFDVARWASNVDFRINMAMQSASDNSVMLDGVLTCYERHRFRPVDWLVLSLGSLGVLHGAKAPGPAPD